MLGLKSFRIQKIVPVLAFLITAIACLVTNSVFHATTWSDVSEEILVSYAFIQLVYTVFMTGGWVGGWVGDFDEVAIQIFELFLCLIAMSLWC